MSEVVPQGHGREGNLPRAGAAAPSAAFPREPAAALRPVIFLDVDGVLNRSSRTTRSKKHVVAPDLLARFKSLAASTNASVILTSTWRHETGGIEKAKELGIPFDGIVPDLRPRSRGAEVKAWLARHLEVERFVILDDDDDDYENMPLFQPNPYAGLSTEVAAAAQDYLDGRRDHDCRRPLLVRAAEYLKSFFEGHRG
jgi:Swiss Army Knife RNA repair-like protein